MKTKKISKKKAREMLYNYILVHGMPITNAVIKSELKQTALGSYEYKYITFRDLLKIAYES
jgi:hypothetical protein